MPAPHLPPGPRSRLISTLRQAIDPVATIRGWNRRYGPTFTVRDLLSTTVFTSDPELVREVMGADPELFAGNPAFGDVLFGLGSVGMIAGAEHRRQRKLLAPFFAKPSLENWAPTVAEVTQRVFAGLAPGDEIELRERMLEVAVRVIVQLIFGARGEREEPLVAAALRWRAAIRPGFLLIRPLRSELGGLLPYHRYARARETLDALLQERIEAARADTGPSTDLLHALTRARDEAGKGFDDLTIIENLRLLLFGGHETTGYTMTWALAFLHDHAHTAMRTRLRNELDATSSSARPLAYVQLPYLGAVLDETLRLRTVLTHMFRILAKPWQLGPWQLPAGTAIAPASFIVHRDPERWPDPERFAPERFLDQRPAASDYLSFGGSHRRCPGASFALYEARVALATLLQRYEFEPLSSAEIRIEQAGLSLGPSAVMMRVAGVRAG